MVLLAWAVLLVACRRDRPQPALDTQQDSARRQPQSVNALPANADSRVDTLTRVALHSCAPDSMASVYAPAFLLERYPADTSAAYSDWNGSEDGDSVVVAIQSDAPAPDSTVLFAWLAPRGPSPDSLPFLVPIDSLGAWYRVNPNLWRVGGRVAHGRALVLFSVEALVVWGGLHNSPWRELTRVAAVVWTRDRCAQGRLTIHIPV